MSQGISLQNQHARTLSRVFRGNSSRAIDVTTEPTPPDMKRTLGSLVRCGSAVSPQNPLLAAAAEPHPRRPHPRRRSMAEEFRVFLPDLQDRKSTRLTPVP